MPNLTRNHYFFLGMLILLVGLQFRFVQTYKLKQPVAKYIAKKIHKTAPGEEPTPEAAYVQSGGDIPDNKRSVQPPKYLNLSCISIGAVLILHGVAMRPN